MKLVVAYVDSAEFEPIRVELIELGIPTMSITNAGGSHAEADVTGSYRGAAMESHVRPKVRIEAVVSDDTAPALVDTLLRHEGKGMFTYVVNVEQALPETYVGKAAAATT
jgi:nitrogen regulatory protein PII